jgi:hypothetical protein
MQFLYSRFFARNYRQLYTCVSYDDAEMCMLLEDIDNRISVDNMHKAGFVVAG